MLIDYKLGDFFPDWANGGGIFSALDDDGGAPWSEDVDPDLLDVVYFGNRSGDKPPSPLVFKLADNGEVPLEGRAKLARILLATNLPNWERLYATLSASYNALTPIQISETLLNDETVKVYGHTRQRTDNLSHGVTGSETRTPNLSTTDSGTESTTRTPNLTETRTPNLSTTDSGTESTTRTPNLTETRTPNTTETTTNGIYGFNSSSASNSDTSQKTETGTETKATTGTETNATTSGNTRTETGTEQKATTGTETNATTSGNTRTETGTETRETTGTETNATTSGNTRTETGTEQKATTRTETDTGTVSTADTGRDTVTRGYTRTRTGNDGRRTAAELLMQERESWLWNYFYDVVFPAVDHLLTLPIYGGVCYCPHNTGWESFES